MDKDCIFCKIITGEIPSAKIYEDDQNMAFLDVSAETLGHTLVVSKTHTKNFAETPTEVLNSVISVVQKIANHYLKCGFDGFKVVTNNGESSGQSVMHLHFHILPSVNSENTKFFGLKKDDLKSVCERLKF